MTICDNMELPKIEKYLVKYLIGDARRAIERIQLADANYDLAVSAFMQKFS